jgi:hypothetical protein
VGTEERRRIYDDASVAFMLPPVCFAFSSSARFWPMILADTCSCSNRQFRRASIILLERRKGTRRGESEEGSYTHVTDVDLRPLDAKLAGTLEGDEGLLELTGRFKNGGEIEADLWRRRGVRSRGRDWQRGGRGVGEEVERKEEERKKGRERKREEKKTRTSPSSGLIIKAFCKCSNAFSGLGGLLKM